MESNFAFCGVRTHAYYRIVDLKSTPLDLSGKNAVYFAVFCKLIGYLTVNFIFVAVRKHFCSITGSNRGPLAHKTNALTN